MKARPKVILYTSCLFLASAEEKTCSSQDSWHVHADLTTFKAALCSCNSVSDVYTFMTCYCNLMLLTVSHYYAACIIFIVPGLFKQKLHPLVEQFWPPHFVPANSGRVEKFKYLLRCQCKRPQSSARVHQEISTVYRLVLFEVDQKLRCVMSNLDKCCRLASPRCAGGSQEVCRCLLGNRLRHGLACAQRHGKIRFLEASTMNKIQESVDFD